MTVAVVLLAVGVTPLVRICLKYHRRNQRFPVLLAFDETWYGELCYTNQAGMRIVAPPADWPREGHAPALVARLDAAPAKYAGIVFSEPYPDWRGYRWLEFEVHLDDPEPRDFVLRIDDRQHDKTFADRFQGHVTLQPGFQTVRFDLEDVKQGPQHRELQLGQVSAVVLFAVDLDRELTVYLGAMRLTK